MTDKKTPKTIDDADLDAAQGAGAAVAPFITRDESEVTALHGSDFNAAMGNSGHPGRTGAMGNSGRDKS